MLNNQQFYDAQGAGDQMVCTESWKDNTLCKLPLAPLDDEPNAIDVEAALEQVKKNDSSLTELNLNNVYNIQIDTIVEFCEALKDSGNPLERYFSPLLFLAKITNKLVVNCLRFILKPVLILRVGKNGSLTRNFVSRLALLCKFYKKTFFNYPSFIIRLKVQHLCEVLFHRQHKVNGRRRSGARGCSLPKLNSYNSQY